MGFRYSKPTFLVVKVCTIFFLTFWKSLLGSWLRLRFCSESSSQKYEKVMCSYICKIFQDCTEKDLTFEAFCTQLGSTRYIHICKSKTDFLRLLPTKSFAFAKYSTEQLHSTYQPKNKWQKCDGSLSITYKAKLF